MIYCFKGCTFDDLRPQIEAVHSEEFEWDRNEYERHKQQQAERDEQKQNRAKEIMEAATTGSDIIESYLAGRGIDFDFDKDLTPTYGINYNCPSPDGGNHPALVFEVQDAEGWLRGVHRTFLEQGHNGQ